MSIFYNGASLEIHQLFSSKQTHTTTKQDNYSGGSGGSTARGGVTYSARSAAGGGCGRGKPPPAGGGSGASPGKIFEKWMQMVHPEPIFLPSSCRFSPKKLCVIFAFKALIFDICDVGEFSPYL